MNERKWWSSHVRRFWHRPHEGFVAWKVEDKFFSGMPDVDCMFGGVACKIELKYEVKWPARADTTCWFSYLDKVTKKPAIVSAAQWNHLNEWQQGGGLAFVCIGIGKEWLLLRQGEYDNVPMTQQELKTAAILSMSGPQQYSSLMEIPTYIRETYGR